MFVYLFYFVLFSSSLIRIVVTSRFTKSAGSLRNVPTDNYSAVKPGRAVRTWMGDQLQKEAVVAILLFSLFFFNFF